MDEALEGRVMSETENLDQPPVPDDAPEADAAEQRAALEEEAPEYPDHVPFDANEADAAEQGREISLDEDEYR